MAIERTYLMVKPDGVARGLVGEIISRFERKGLRLEEVRMLTIDEELARRHYAEHVDKAFFPELLEFITSGPVVAMAWSGESAVAVGRALDGPRPIRRGSARHYPRRLRDGRHREPGARVGLVPERRARARHLLPLTLAPGPGWTSPHT